MSSSTTFAVDNVTPNTSLLPTCKPLEAIQSQFNKLDTISPGNSAHCRVETCWDNTLDCVAKISCHPLIAAAHLAFSEHRPLVLSPDVIWVTIVQGLARHIHLNPEKYRSLLVQHEGRRKLQIEVREIDWSKVVTGLVSLLCQETGGMAKRFVCDFSTTGPVERMVSEIALLDMFQPYFTYKVREICGIPFVTLEGTKTDWQKLRKKVDLLAPFGLDWWLKELRPICDQFIRAAAGNVDQNHWCRIYKIRKAYGTEVINGWIGKLFPYIKDCNDGVYSRWNDLLNPKVEAEIRKLEKEERLIGQETVMRFGVPGICIDSLPCGLSRVPLLLEYLDGSKEAMEFLAGSIAVTQDKETAALRPVLGWAACEAAPIEQAMIRLADHKVKTTEIPLSIEVLKGFDLYYIPTDMLRCYNEVSEGVIFDKNRVPLYKLLPINEWKHQKWKSDQSGLMTSNNLRFAVLRDGTELVIRLYCPEKKHTDAVFVGCTVNGSSVHDIGYKIAKSFTDFLFHALDGGSKPYFRRRGFVSLNSDASPKGI